jgi:hypothetical protein
MEIRSKKKRKRGMRSRGEATHQNALSGAIPITRLSRLAKVALPHQPSTIHQQFINNSSTIKDNKTIGFSSNRNHKPTR